MGNKASQEDQEPLLTDGEAFTLSEIPPIFAELKLVLIGIQGAGKNTICNAIFREKVFTFWTSYRSEHIKETRKVSGTEIHLARTPGWSGELSRSEKTKREIVHCVQSLYNTGPHAVLLALKVNSILSESTICTLESLLTDKLWDHTIVLFTHGEKLGYYSIEDYIRSMQLQTLINKCGQRYFVIQKNDRNQITDKIEELIVRKNSATCFELSDQTEGDVKKLSDLKCLVERIKSKINSISTSMEKLLLNPKTQNNDSIKELLDSKDAEISRLNTIVEEKEREIERLQSTYSRTQDPALIDPRRVAELEETLDLKNKEIMEKDKRIDELTKELQMLRGTTDQRTPEDQYAHAGYRSKLGQDVTTVPMRGHTEIQLHDRPSEGSGLRNWGDTLLQILNGLSDCEVKRMKYYMQCNDEYRIPISFIEGRDRVDLAKQMLKQWDDRSSIRKTRDLIKKVPRNDDVMVDLFTPYLKVIGETW